MTVVPKSVDASVHVRALEDRSATLAQRHNFAHQIGFGALLIMMPLDNLLG